MSEHERLDPATIVIFGASGDLTRRKLIPALFTLHRGGLLPECFVVLGTARSELDDTAFRQRMAAGLFGDGAPAAGWDEFARHLHYQPLAYDDAGDYRALAARLDELAATHDTGGNRLFNLALPPALYETVARRLAAAGLASEGPDRWVRLVVEKPFGRDLASARELDAAIREGFAEHQVFRIDHYMAKETVQNILMFRFANAIFEPIWNRRYIDQVRITAAESLGVEHRAGYYESAGVLRDMFQNHMMQLLALVAAEPPPRYEPELVRDEKVKLLGSVRPLPLDDKWRQLVLGQYDAGTAAGPVPGYRDEPGVAPGSQTATFATVRLWIDNWRWQGVPFYLTSGKRLGAKRTHIEIRFKEVPLQLFREVVGEDIGHNWLTLGIYPDEEIRLSIQAKRPGDRPVLRPVSLHFDYAEGHDGRAVDAYEKSLADALRGDHTLFWRSDGLQASWALFDPIISACEACGERGANLFRYPAGSDGPDELYRRFPALREPAP
jgi:glucose-6-phosphate 1-dehydrogenase